MDNGKLPCGFNKYAALFIFSIIHFQLFYPSVKLIIRFRRFGFTNPFSGWLGLVAPFGLYAGMVTRLHNIHISSSGL